MNKRLLIIIISTLTFSVYAEVYSVIPVETVGFAAGSDKLFYSEIINQLIGKKQMVVDSASINKVLEAWEYNLSDIVGYKTKEISFGKMLQTRYLVFFSFVWNGKYTLIDVHLTDIQENRIVFQKAYTSTKSAEMIAKSGIKEIVNEMFGENAKVSFFDTAEIIERSENTNEVIRWARSRGISIIFITYIGGVDGSTLNSDYTKKYEPEKLKYYFDVYEEAIKLYKILKQQGEYVRFVHLGSLDKYNGYLINDDSVSISYEFPGVLLKKENVGVVFFGKDSEVVKIESTISKTNSIRFWHKMRWNEGS